MCRLGDWVTVNTLERMQTIPIDIALQPKRNRQEQPGIPGDKWWGTAAISSRLEHRCDRGKKPDVEKTRGMRLCLQGPPQTPKAPSQNFQETSQPVSQDQTQNVLTGMVEEAAQDPEEVLKMVRDQYQEALYASKVRHSSCTGFGLNVDCILSRHWHILRKGPCLELELLSMSMMALPTITRI